MLILLDGINSQTVFERIRVIELPRYAGVPYIGFIDYKYFRLLAIISELNFGTGVSWPDGNLAWQSQV